MPQDELMRIRLPADLKERIRQRAAENGHSMNAEIVLVLTNELQYKNVDERLVATEKKLEEALEDSMFFSEKLEEMDKKVKDLTEIAKRIMEKQSQPKPGGQ